MCFIAHDVLCIVFKCDHSRNVRARAAAGALSPLSFFCAKQGLAPHAHNGRTFPVLCIPWKQFINGRALSIDARVALHAKHLSINSVVSATKDPFFALAPLYLLLFCANIRFHLEKKPNGGFLLQAWPLDQPLSSFQFSFTLRCPPPLGRQHDSISYPLLHGCLAE